MKEIEFMTKGDGQVIVIEEDKVEPLKEREDVIKLVYDIIEADYPEAFAALQNLYFKLIKFEWDYRFAIVSRFLRCNCGNYDPLKFDLHHGQLSLEFVSCPMRGECKQEGIICKAKKSGSLTKCQLQVAKLIATGYSRDSIADLLDISKSTLKQHVASIHRKLELSNDAEIANYVNG